MVGFGAAVPTFGVSALASGGIGLAGVGATTAGYVKGVSRDKYEQVNKVFSNAINACTGPCAAVEITGQYYEEHPNSLFNIQAAMLDEQGLPVVEANGEQVKAIITSGTNLDASAVHNSLHKVRQVM